MKNHHKPNLKSTQNKTPKYLFGKIQINPKPKPLLPWNACRRHERESVREKYFFQIWRDHRFDRERDGGEREIISFRDEKEQEERIVQEKEEERKKKMPKERKRRRRKKEEEEGERERERENSGEVCGAGEVK